jgi:hypothetical protein
VCISLPRNARRWRSHHQKEKPSFARHGQWFVASWSKGPHSYMLAGEEGEPMLRELIARRGVPQQVAAWLPLR